MIECTDIHSCSSHELTHVLALLLCAELACGAGSVLLRARLALGDLQYTLADVAAGSRLTSLAKSRSQRCRRALQSL